MYPKGDRNTLPSNIRTGPPWLLGPLLAGSPLPLRQPERAPAHYMCSPSLRPDATKCEEASCSVPSRTSPSCTHAHARARRRERGWNQLWGGGGGGRAGTVELNGS